MLDTQKLTPLTIAGGLLWAAYKFAANAAVKFQSSPARERGRNVRQGEDR
jgi:hypothetical protein